MPQRPELPSPAPGTARIADAMASASPRLRAGLPDAADPDVLRVRAVIESRLLGATVATARIGRFTILERLAEGGMGVVYAAYDNELDRKVAIKLLRTDRDDDTVRRRIVREAQAMAKLSHPNVAHVYEVGDHGGRTFIAMELVRGQTLRAWRVASARSWRAVLDVYAQAGRGLAAAHAAGLVHRDFKPDNAMIGSDGRVRVLDFGLAREDAGEPTDSAGGAAPTDDAIAPPLTKTGTFLGTPGYMSPEQFFGGAVDAKSDQFAFCVALYEAFYAERPFAGATRAEICASVACGQLRDEPRGAAVPGFIRPILVRGLAIAPAERWPRMDDLLAALLRAERRIRTRRVVAALVVAGVAGLGIEGARRYDVARREAACEREGARIADAWNDDTRERVRTAVLATGAAFAPSTEERLIPRLEAHAQAWQAATTAACLDAEIHGTSDSAVLEQSRWCLDERRLAFEMLVDEVLVTDGHGLTRALEAAARLPPSEECRDVDALRQHPIPAAELRADVRRIAGDLAHSRAESTLGEYQQALATAEPALAAAKALGWDPLEAIAGAQVGDMLSYVGRFPEAEAVLVEAYFLAARSGAHQTAHTAASKLALVVGERQARSDEGLHWARLAEVEEARLSGSDGVHAALRLSCVGLIHQASGAFSIARDAHAQALAIDERIHGSLHPILVPALNNLAMSMVSAGAYEEAKPVYERALALVEATFGSEHPDVAMVLDNLSIVYDDMGAYRDAIELQERGLAIREKSLGHDHPAVGYSLVNLGAARYAVGDYAIARDLDERALAIREKAYGPDHPAVALVLANLGGSLLALGDVEAARVAGERAVAIAEKALGPDHPRVAACINVLAAVSDTTGDYATSRALHERALKIREKALGPDHVEVARSLAGVGSAEVGEGQLAIARPRLERALAIIDAAVGRDHPDNATLLEDLARAYAGTGAAERGLGLAQRALALREKKAEPLGVARSLSALGAVELARGRNAAAIAALERALDLRERNGAMPVQLAESRLELARARRSTGRAP